MSEQQPKLPPVTPAIRAKAEENLRKARVQMVLHQPFFASIFLRRQTALDDKLDTAMVDRGGKITLGTGFIARLNVQEVVFLLAHESMHYAMLHHNRRQWREKDKWNEACDRVINDILTDAKVGQTVKECGAFQPGAREKTAEEIYDLIKAQDPSGGDNNGQGKGKGKGQKQPGGGGGGQPGTGSNDLSEAVSEQEVSAEDIEKIKQELLQARTAAKAQGKMPAALEAFIEGLVNPITPWHQLLERFMLNYVKAGVSFRKPNKRFIGNDIYMPSTDKNPHLGTIVVQIDESGSIGKKELEHFSGHLNKILETCMPEKVIVLHTDTRVAKVEEFVAEDLPINLKSYAGGGTDMEEGIRYTDTELGIEPDVFITLTDMYTGFNEKHAPAYPVVWLSTTKDIVAPYGETIFYQITD